MRRQVLVSALVATALVASGAIALGAPTPPPVGIGNAGMTPAERAAMEAVPGAPHSFGGGLPNFIGARNRLADRVTLSTTAASSAAATRAASMCLAAQPTRNAKLCGVGTAAPLTVTTLLPLDPDGGTYRLSITSAKPGGLSKPRWAPPANMSITAITAAENGKCVVVGGRIACVVTKPTPSVTVDFTASILPIEIEGPDAPIAVTFLDIPRGLFRLQFFGRTASGVIEAFTWTPPAGMTITAITSSQGGKCVLASGRITCRGGGKGSTKTLSVDFLADGLKPTFNGRYWTLYGPAPTRLPCGPISCPHPHPYHIPP
jgi:hypothetical protein